MWYNVDSIIFISVYRKERIMFIAYSKKNGVEYAALATSVRHGAKVGKGKPVNLGRVLDKERNIFRNRERGVFTYNPQTGQYGPAPADFIEPPKRRKGKYIKDGRKKRSVLLLQFGDIYFYDCFINSLGILKAVDAIEYGNKDTLHALLCYYVTSPEPNCRAQFWYDVSYARVLYPKATLASQRISDALAEIGIEENRRRFYSKYIEFVTGCTMNDTKDQFGMIPDGLEGDGVLIDSSGLPNCAKLPVTAISNHNGIISNEVRVIYVVHQRTGLPLFMRYVSGNVVDATTIKRTLLEMKGLGIDVKFALLDAGYYNGKNADALYDAKVSFVTRTHSSNKVFTDAVKMHRAGLESKENLVCHNGGLYYIKRVDVMLGSKSNRKAYGYLCLDLTTQSKELRKVATKAEDENESPDEIYGHIQEAGLFMLVSSRAISKEHILSLYYTRNQVEEIFRIGKTDGKMLPLEIHQEDTLRGHLVMTLLSTTIIKILQDRLQGTKLSPSEVFSTLSHQGALICPDSLVSSDPVKKMNDIYKHFKIECPEEIPYTPTPDERTRM